MPHDPVARIRRFNRAVTRETGALDQSFLGRGRPLGPARVLHAIGPDGTDLETIRAYLDLEKALLSRFLKTLQDDGLITLDKDPEDGRRRVARLSQQGRAERDAYNELSNSRARALLDRHPKPEALLAAMDLVASALGRDRVDLTEADPRSTDAVYCLSEYYAELGRRFDTGFDVNLSRDPEATDMMPPRGSFLIARSDGLPLGCVGLKGTDKGYGEIKRLWVSPAARGLGLARRLMDAAEDAARALGIPLLRLDTNSALPEAVALYRNSGWTEIDRFNDDPYPDHFFEKVLG
ncbi:putative acetyltransferase [Thalassovita gelatinovora]|uniref:Putative acetyltransferase n=1 Tax=Thalassovita gelatinovora TaxID=53501 RepID=A0A0P1FH06_THAGE|nr:bifunctional helix-turn-helix transcriptional regulator/GNAT family N-acetyltransferase [Thalassovita gelatinovora]QIZ81924.1 GNAT family N-acetyltransferase [Thalassovita gelatinovora]CUH67296.1 putative acetyltransferase [Thalassovita gelatinovora]SEP76758.1 transcriptional regulator, MarR family with acetyltransferase activity [Thalassovita gelatinovora]